MNDAIMKPSELLDKWEQENNPFYPSQMKMDRLTVREIMQYTYQYIMKSAQEEIEQLECKLSDYQHTLSFIAAEKECPHCGKPMVNGYICPHCRKDPNIEYSDNLEAKK